MSGKSNTPNVTTPTPPPAPPSYASQLQDYIKTLPDLLQAQQTYDPKFAQQQLDLINQYGGPISESLQSIDESLYPNTSKLQEAVAGQALNGLSSNLPDQISQQYLSDFNAGIGANANAPIGVNSRNIGLYNLQEDWKRYYQNLALTTAGRQPLQGATSPTSGGSTSGFGPALQYGASTYGQYANAFGNQNAIASPRSGGFNALGGVGGAAGGALAGAYVGSIVPGLGTAIGAGIGGIAGGALGSRF